VIYICAHCGATIVEGNACKRCDVSPVSDEPNASAPESPALRTEGNLAIAPDWRAEVARRLVAHRARRHQLCPDAVQSDFSFEALKPFEAPEPVAEPTKESKRSEPSAAAPIPFQQPPRPVAPPRRPRASSERIQIDLSQPALNFDDDQNSSARPDLPAVSAPLASLVERRRAGLLDAAVLLLAYGAFLAIFYELDGRWTFSKLDMAVTLGTMAIFYAQYFAFFMLFGGATPGMLLRGLHVVTFDGDQPPLPQLFWRSIGYLVSAGTLFLGFVWALWDPQHLSWHDHISQTCITPRPRQASP
jgi:uncharacterized RDD family membrane protein YckC